MSKSEELLHKTVNEIIAYGQFSNLFMNNRGEHILALRLQDGEDGTIQFRVTEPVTQRFTLGDYVTVRAHEVGFIYEDEYIHQKKYIHYHELDSVKPTITEMASRFGITGRTYPRKRCDVYLQGILTRTEETNEVTRNAWIRIAGTGEDQRPKNIRLTFFKELDDMFNTLQTGDYVCVKAYVRVLHNKKTYLDMLILQDIALAP